MSPGLRRFAARVRALKAALLDPPWQPGGHYYSPIPSATDTQRAISADGPWIGVDLHEDAQRVLMDELLPIALEFDNLKGGRWGPNDMFGRADAAVYWSVLHHRRPTRVVEIGSGYSTAVVLDYAATGSPISLVSIDPSSARLTDLLRPSDDVEIIRTGAQEVPIEVLTSGDLLFIDSTHVAKAGSDVNWLMFEVLPRVPVGTWIHIHDIFWPRGYPRKWLLERRAWNEAYMLRAFLMYNSSFEIRLFNNLLARSHPPFADAYRGEPGSVWIERVRD